MSSTDPARRAGGLAKVQLATLDADTGFERGLSALLAGLPEPM